MKKTILFLIFTFCLSSFSNAQFFKKLGDKIEKAAERTIERKVEQKTQRETEKAFDSAFNRKNKKKRRKNKNIPTLSKIQPAESYTFIHKVEMQMNMNKDIITVNYFLAASDDFLGVQMNDKNIEVNLFNVLDIKRDAMFTFMENKGQKTKIAINLETDKEALEDLKFEVKETGKTKTILGYNCKEFVITSKDMTANMWVTKDLDIRFPNDFYSVNQKENNMQGWMKDLEGWAMEAVIIDTSQRKPQTTKMTTLSFENSNLTITSNDYQNIQY